MPLKRGRSLNQKVGISPDIESVGTLILDFVASRIMRNRFLFLRHPIYLVKAARNRIIDQWVRIENSKVDIRLYGSLIHGISGIPNQWKSIDYLVCACGSSDYPYIKMYSR